MKPDDTRRAPGGQRNVQALLALLTLVLGLGLMGFMIATESEPGLLPLLLVVIGLGWYAATRFRARPRRT